MGAEIDDCVSNKTQSASPQATQPSERYKRPEDTCVSLSKCFIDVLSDSESCNDGRRLILMNK